MGEAVMIVSIIVKSQSIKKKLNSKYISTQTEDHLQTMKQLLKSLLWHVFLHIESSEKCSIF